jgi:hypothetical protein
MESPSLIDTLNYKYKKDSGSLVLWLAIFIIGFILFIGVLIYRSYKNLKEK